MSSTFRRLSRSDLGAFDREARDLILEAMEVGCLGRISSNGHCILHNNTGGTTSIPPHITSLNRSVQNARSDMRRFMAEHRVEDRSTATTRTQREPQYMTVAHAFVEHGAAFSRWFDEQTRNGSGLPADAMVEVTFDDGKPCFTVREIPRPSTSP
ncbi:hypothetical protein [Streptomyces sp. NPDC007083]|uniref:hypothetical protein n=1 Tax=Streptomyces sp. NPDC007083 TaxID=3156913 RepID=UPI00340BE559